MSITRIEDINEYWNEFESVFGSTVFYHAQSKTLNKNDQNPNAKPWITKGIIISIKKKN